MANSYSVLQNEEPEETTKNPQRKLEKMKRQYSAKPTPELKKKIEEMDSRLNPNKEHSKKKNSKKNSGKKKKYNEEKAKIQKAKQEEKAEKARIKKEKVEEENRAYKEREEKLKQANEEYRKKQEEKRYQEYKERANRKYQEKLRRKDKDYFSYITKEGIKKELPDDIKEFKSNAPDKKMFRKLVLIYHPDKGGDEELFKIINNHKNQSK